MCLYSAYNVHCSSCRSIEALVSEINYLLTKASKILYREKKLREGVAIQQVLSWICTALFTVRRSVKLNLGKWTPYLGLCFNSRVC